MQAGMDSSIPARARGSLVGFDGPGLDGKPATWCNIPGPGRGSDTPIGPESRDFRPV